MLAGWRKNLEGEKLMSCEVPLPSEGRRMQGVVCRAYGVVFGVLGAGCRVQDVGFRV